MSINKGYNLDTLAGYYGVQIENKKKPDEVAKDLVTQLVQQSRCNNVRLRVEQHPIFVFNGTKVDNIMGCYDSQHNKSDVGVMEDEKTNEKYHGSNIVNMEVNSSPMKSTVVKTLHGLIELARIVKAYSIPNKIVTLVGFALPKLNDQGVAVRVQVWYDPECMAFSVSSKPLSCSDFFPELQSAITDNCEVLRKCKESKLRSGYKNHVL